MNIASTEYIDKKLSAFTPGPSLKGTYDVELDGRSLFRVGPEAPSVEIGPGGGDTKELVINSGYVPAGKATAQVKLTSEGDDVTLKIEDALGSKSASLDFSHNLSFEINHGLDNILRSETLGDVTLQSPHALRLNGNNSPVFIGPVNAPQLAVGSIDNNVRLMPANGAMSIYVEGPVTFASSVYDKNGNEITGGSGGGGDYSNQIWTETNDRYFGDKTLGWVHLSGSNGVYVNWDNMRIVSADMQTGVTFGTYSGYFNTSLVSPETLYIRPSAKSYPSVGLDISANQNSTYISGPVKFSEIYDNDGKQITAGGYSYISEDSYNISIGSDYGITTTIGHLDTSSTGDHTFIYGDSINLSSYENMRIAGRDITFSNFSSVNSRVTFNNSVFIEGPLFLNGKEITGDGGYSYISEDTTNRIVSFGNNCTSVFVDGPTFYTRWIQSPVNGGSILVQSPVTFEKAIYDKNGNEITAGGGGSVQFPLQNNVWDGEVLYNIGGPADMHIPIISVDSFYTGTYIFGSYYIGGVKVMAESNIILHIDGTELTLNKDKLKKLADFIDTL